MALLPPQFWTSDLLNCEKIDFYYFKAPSVVICYGSRRCYYLHFIDEKTEAEG